MNLSFHMKVLSLQLLVGIHAVANSNQQLQVQLHSRYLLA
jgi:hypothetical protein